MILAFMLFEAEQQTQMETHANEVKSAIEKIGILGSVQLSCLTMSTLTHDPSYASQYKSAATAIETQFNLLQAACQSDPKLLAAEQRFRQIITSDVNKMAALQNGLQVTVQSDRPINMLDAVMAAPKIRAVIHEQLKAGDEFSAAAAIEHPAQGDISANSWANMIEVFIAVGLIVNIIASLLFARHFSSKIIARLNALVENSVRLGAGEALKPRLGGKDEISIVDGVFHKMAEELEAGSRRQRAIVDNAVEVICALDRNGRFASVNPASGRVLGYEPQNLVGRNLADIVIEEDRSKTRMSLESAAESEGESSFESRCDAGKEGIAHILWSVRWSTEEQSYFCVAHDITERKLAEALLRESEASVRLILEGMPVGMLIADDSGTIEVFNTRLAQMFSYEPNELGQQSLDGLFSAGLTAKVQRFFADRETAQGEIKSSELTAKKKDGTTFSAELSFAKLMLSSEPKLLAVVFDITKRKEVEQLKKELVAMVGHDLRSPLMSIQGTFSLLLTGRFIELDEQSQAYLSASENEAGQLIELINGLLDIEKLESGQMHLEKQFNDMSTLMSRAVSSVGSLAQQRDIQISIEPAQCNSYCDSAKIVQVLVNLLANAIKRSPTKAEVTVSATVEGTDVEVKVSDSGQLIPPTQAMAIFDKFRASSTSDRSDKSAPATRSDSGLGLAICKAIVESHGGTISVTSSTTADGVNTTFSFRIARQPEEAESAL